MAIALESLPGLHRGHRGRRFDFDTLRSAAELRAHADHWRRLDRHAASPMQTLAWIEAAAATFADDGQAEILIGDEDDEIVAAAPMVPHRRFMASRRELLTYRGLFEPADLAFVDAEANAALARGLVRVGRPFFFERLFANSPTITSVERVAAGRGKLIVRPQAATPWIALDETWSSPEQKLSSKRRSDFRRSSRHAEQAGPVRCELLAPSADQVDGLLDRAFEVERRSWKGAVGTSLAVSRAGDFYRRYARRTASQHRFRVAFLHIGGKLAAMQLGVVHANRYWVLKVGYDPQFHRASPGILLMVEAIKQAVAECLETYELLGTVEPWIQVWTELERPCVSLRYYPANISGALTFAADAIDFARARRREACKR